MPTAATPAPEHSDVVVFPPVIPVTAFLLGVLLEAIWPLATLGIGSMGAPLRLVGAALLCAGAVGFAWMVVTMRRARTPINNYKTPTALVETGPFRFSRNPMYLFGSIAYAGLALLLLQLWSLALLPLMHAAMHYGVVLREEAFLERRFGSAYQAYRARVRRYL